MKRLLTIIALSASLAFPSFAKTHKLPKDDAICSITFPNGWKVEVEDEALDAHSPDEEIFINIEVNDAGSIEGALLESAGYLKKNKVIIDKTSEKKTEGKVNGMDMTDYSWNGKDEGGPTKVSFTIVHVSDNKMLLILYWASPAGETTHKEALSKIMQSLKKV